VSTRKERERWPASRFSIARTCVHRHFAAIQFTGGLQIGGVSGGCYQRMIAQAPRCLKREGETSFDYSKIFKLSQFLSEGVVLIEKGRLFYSEWWSYSFQL